MKYLKGSKRAFGLGDYVNMAVYLVIAAMVMGIGALILLGVKNGSSDATFTGIITNGLTGITTMSAQNPTIALVGTGAVLLGLVIGVFGGFIGSSGARGAR